MPSLAELFGFAPVSDSSGFPLNLAGWPPFVEPKAPFPPAPSRSLQPNLYQSRFEDADADSMAPTPGASTFPWPWGTAVSDTSARVMDQAPGPRSGGLLGNHPIIRGEVPKSSGGILQDRLVDSFAPQPTSSFNSRGAIPWPVASESAPWRDSVRDVTVALLHNHPLFGADESIGQDYSLADAPQATQFLPQTFGDFRAADNDRATGFFDGVNADSTILSDADPDDWIPGVQYAQVRRGPRRSGERPLSIMEELEPWHYQHAYETLRELDPTNRELRSLHSPEWRPKREDTRRLQDEIARIRAERCLFDLERHHPGPL
jgi:hypothetical protein